MVRCALFAAFLTSEDEREKAEQVTLSGFCD